MATVDNARMKRCLKVLPSIYIEQFDNQTYCVHTTGEQHDLYYATDILATVKYLIELPEVYQPLMPSDWAKAIAVYHRLS